MLNKIFLLFLIFHVFIKIILIRNILIHEINKNKNKKIIILKSQIKKINFIYEKNIKNQI